MRRAIVLVLMFGGCRPSGPAPMEAPREDDKTQFGRYIQFMESNELHLNFLATETDDAKAKRRLKIIRTNIVEARAILPSQFKAAEPYFDDFLKMEAELEVQPWNAAGYDRLSDGCTHCHDHVEK